MTVSHHDFKRLVHRTYVSPYETCINSDSKRRHSIRSDIAWVAELANGDTGPVGPVCARAIAESLGVRLRDLPNLVKKQDEALESHGEHDESACTSGTSRAHEFNDGAVGRLSKAQAYVRDYRGLTEALSGMGLGFYFQKDMPGFLKARLHPRPLSEETARIFMRTAEDASEFKMDHLKDMHKLLKRLTLMQADCLRQTWSPELRNPDWETIHAKPNFARSREDWISMGKVVVPECIRHFINRAAGQDHDDREPYLTRSEAAFCALLAVRDLGRGGDYFRREEFAAFIRPDNQAWVKPSAGEPLTQETFDF